MKEKLQQIKQFITTATHQRTFAIVLVLLLIAGLPIVISAVNTNTENRQHAALLDIQYCSGFSNNSTPNTCSDPSGNCPTGYVVATNTNNSTGAIKDCQTQTQSSLGVCCMNSPTVTNTKALCSAKTGYSCSDTTCDLGSNQTAGSLYSDCSSLKLPYCCGPTPATSNQTPPANIQSSQDTCTPAGNICVKNNTCASELGSTSIGTSGFCTTPDTICCTRPTANTPNLCSSTNPTTHLPYHDGINCYNDPNGNSFQVSCNNGIVSVPTQSCSSGQTCQDGKGCVSTGNTPPTNPGTTTSGAGSSCTQRQYPECELGNTGCTSQFGVPVGNVALVTVNCNGNTPVYSCVDTGKTCNTSGGGNTPPSNGQHTMVTLAIKLPGIPTTNDSGQLQAPLHTTRTVHIQLFDKGVTVNESTPAKFDIPASGKTVTYDSNTGFFITSSPLDLGTTIPTADYQIFVKIDGYLRKQVTNSTTTAFTLTQGQTNALAQITLIPGDIAPIFNQLDIIDFNAIRDCFGSTSTSVKSSCQSFTLADLNDDGKIDGVDVNILLIGLRMLLVDQNSSTNNGDGPLGP